MWNVRSLKGYTITKFERKEHAIDFMQSAAGLHMYNLIWIPE